MINKNLHTFLLTKTSLRWICIVGYVFVGYFIGSFLNSSSKKCLHHSYSRKAYETNVIHKSFKGSSNIYIGMMSARKYVSSRVQTALYSWLSKGQWKVEVFADFNSSFLFVPPELDFQVVTLPAVDDSAYPPQKKCIMMLRHMYNNFKDDFDWFLRVDDDVYIDYPRLSKFLAVINSSLPMFIGAPGFGKNADDELNAGMFYLMGGPGVIMSRGLLLLLRSHLSYCIQHMFSPHEDIELGRCVKTRVENVVTPLAWEILDYFYQHYDKKTGEVTNIELNDLPQDKMLKLLTFHPVKSEALLNQLHKIVLEKKIKFLVNQTASLKCEVQRMIELLKLKDALQPPFKTDSQLPLILGLSNHKDSDKSGLLWPESAPWLSPHHLIPRHTSHLVWLNWDKYYCHQANADIPMKGHSKREQDALWQWKKETELRFLKTSCPDFGDNPQFFNGYMALTHIDGVYLTYTYKAYSKFGEKYCNIFVYIRYGVTLSDVNQTDLFISPQHYQVMCQKHLNNSVALPLPCRSLVDAKRVVLVIPVQDRYRELKRFMSHYKKNFLQPFSNSDPLKIQLVLVLFSGNQDNFDLKEASLNLLRGYQRTYGFDLVRFHLIVNEQLKFSRGAGIQLGSLAALPHDILFFMDIDMLVTPNLIQQCRTRARQGLTAWYPISFSQYDPTRLCFEGEYLGDRSIVVDEIKRFKHEMTLDQIERTPLVLSEERGFWRDFGFGIACVHRSDFMRAGGFDLTIEGWGQEDVDLYLSLLKTGLDVFRSNQVDLVHIFHSKQCPNLLTGDQLISCLRTKATHYASQRCLSVAFHNKVDNHNL